MNQLLPSLCYNWTFDPLEFIITFFLHLNAFFESQWISVGAVHFGHSIECFSATKVSLDWVQPSFDVEIKPSRGEPRNWQKETKDENNVPN